MTARLVHRNCAVHTDYYVQCVIILIMNKTQ